MPRRPASTRGPDRRRPGCSNGWDFRQTSAHAAAEAEAASLAAAELLAAEYVARAGRLAARPLPRSLARELRRSLLYEQPPAADSLWNGKPQHYFESMHYGERALSDDDADDRDYDSDSLAP